MAVDFMEQHRMDFEPFVEDDVPFDRVSVSDLPYYSSSSTLQTCAEMLLGVVIWVSLHYSSSLMFQEIQALSLATGVNVVIHQLDSPWWEVQNFGPGVRSIHLSYV